MKIRQLFDHKGTSTLTYLLWDTKTMEGLIIDPVDTHIERDITIINEIGINLKYTIDTHVHADHITGSGPIAKQLDAKIIYSTASKVAGLLCADIYVSEGDTLSLGDESLTILETPGHTSTCITIDLHNKSHSHHTLFTGDALMHRVTGRTDFQMGSPADLFDSVTRLYQFPDNTTVYSGHDYNGLLSTTIGESKKFNSSINAKTLKADFILAEEKINPTKQPPARLSDAVPGCIKCGILVD